MSERQKTVWVKAVAVVDEDGNWSIAGWDGGVVADWVEAASEGLESVRANSARSWSFVRVELQIPKSIFVAPDGESEKVWMEALGRNLTDSDIVEEVIRQGKTVDA